METREQFKEAYRLLRLMEDYERHCVDTDEWGDTTLIHSKLFDCAGRKFHAFPERVRLAAVYAHRPTYKAVPFRFRYERKVELEHPPAIVKRSWVEVTPNRGIPAQYPKERLP